MAESQKDEIPTSVPLSGVTLFWCPLTHLRTISSTLPWLRVGRHWAQKTNTLQCVVPCLTLLTLGAVCDLAWAMLQNPGDATQGRGGALLPVLCSWYKERVWLCSPWEGGLVCLSAHELEKRGEDQRRERQRGG